MIGKVRHPGVLTEVFEHVNLRRPAQRLGQHPERGPQAIALGHAAADFKPAVLLSEFPEGGHHPGSVLARGAIVVGGTFFGLDVQDPVVDCEGVPHVSLQLAIAYLTPRVLGIPFGEVEPGTVKLVLKREFPSGFLLGQARHSGYQPDHSREQSHGYPESGSILPHWEGRLGPSCLPLAPLRPTMAQCDSLHCTRNGYSCSALRWFWQGIDWPAKTQTHHPRKRSGLPDQGRQRREYGASPFSSRMTNWLSIRRSRGPAPATPRPTFPRPARPCLRQIGQGALRPATIGQPQAESRADL